MSRGAMLAGEKPCRIGFRLSFESQFLASLVLSLEFGQELLVGSLSSTPLNEFDLPYNRKSVNTGEPFLRNCIKITHLCSNPSRLLWRGAWT